MGSLTTASLLLGLLQYGPQFVLMAQKLYSDIEAGKGNNVVTADQLAELTRLGSQTSAGIYAKLGITPPPAAPTPVSAP